MSGLLVQNVRFVADIILLASPCVLWSVASTAAYRHDPTGGISIHTQILLLITYLTRYLDIVYEISWYRIMMKAAYILSTALTVAYVLGKRAAWRRVGQSNEVYAINKDEKEEEQQREMVESESSAFTASLLVTIVFCASLSVPFHYDASPYDSFCERAWKTGLEYSWSTSQYIGAIALCPQLRLIWTRRFPKQLSPEPTSRGVLLYLLMLTLHNVLYLVNWALRYTENNEVDPIAIASGSVRFLFLLSFGFAFAYRSSYSRIEL